MDLLGQAHNIVTAHCRANAPCGHRDTVFLFRFIYENGSRLNSRGFAGFTIGTLKIITVKEVFLFNKVVQYRDFGISEFRPRTDLYVNKFIVVYFIGFAKNKVTLG